MPLTNLQFNLNVNFEFDLIPDSLNLKLINLYLFVSAMEIFDIEKKKKALIEKKNSEMKILKR